MASVNETVRTLLLAYPMLYESRVEVLDGVLCALGNGWAWSDNGDIVYVSEDNETFEPWSAEKQRKENEIRYQVMYDLPEDVLASLRERDEGRIEKAAKVHKELSNRMFRMDGLAYFPPQMMGATLLENMPENVTQDWSIACHEMRILAESAGWVFPE